MEGNKTIKDTNSTNSGQQQIAKTRAIQWGWHNGECFIRNLGCNNITRSFWSVHPDNYKKKKKSKRPGSHFAQFIKRKTSHICQVQIVSPIGLGTAWNSSPLLQTTSLLQIKWRMLLSLESCGYHLRFFIQCSLTSATCRSIILAFVVLAAISAIWYRKLRNSASKNGSHLEPHHFGSYVRCRQRGHHMHYAKKYTNYANWQFYVKPYF